MIDKIKSSLEEIQTITRNSFNDINDDEPRIDPTLLTARLSYSMGEISQLINEVMNKIAANGSES